MNPGLLVVVEGLEYAGNLEGARQHPIVLNRHVYHLQLLVKKGCDSDSYACREYLVSSLLVKLAKNTL